MKAYNGLGCIVELNAEFTKTVSLSLGSLFSVELLACNL